MNTFARQSRIPAPADEVFRWHARPGAFARLAPPWESVKLVEESGGIRDGGTAILSIPVGPFRQTWVAEHRDYVEGRQFRDIQIKGPFAGWEHTHSVEPDGPDACILTDRIEYELPFGPLGRWLGDSTVRAKLERMFDYRHRVTAADMISHLQSPGKTPMRILITGSTGLIGSALIPLLTTGGHSVTRLVRSHSGSSEDAIPWDPAAGKLDAARLEGVDAVIHLAGDGIASGRWTAKKKASIRESRVKGTRLLSETLARLERPPEVLLSASAIGYYGNRGDELLDESSPAGNGFLADVCREWEEAADPARNKGIRVVHPRFGVVLSPAGGALKTMLPPFKLGAGGILGGGRQYMSWVAIDDAIGALHYALTQTSISGPLNVVAPVPATNAEFTKTLGHVISRPTIVPMPAFAARMAFGEMADELLLGSQRVVPKKLLASGYKFRLPELEGALRHVLGKGSPGGSVAPNS